MAEPAPLGATSEGEKVEYVAYCECFGGDRRYGLPYAAEYLGSDTLRTVECLLLAPTPPPAPAPASWLAE